MADTAATIKKTGTIVPTEYMFSSAAIRAMENRLCGSARLDRLLELRTVREMLASLSELDIKTVSRPGSSEPDAEETLVALLRDSFRIVRGMIPYPDLIRFMQIPYDAHNVKAIIKCAVREVDPAGMLFDCGTIAPGTLTELTPALIAGDLKLRACLDVLPPHIADAAIRAAAEFARTGNPGCVDRILDRACYEDVAASAAMTRCAFAAELVRCRLDTLNILMTYRVLRRPLAGRETLWETAVLPGGSLDRERLHRALREDENKLTEWLMRTEYRSVAEEYTASGTLSALERAADNAYMQVARRAKMVSFGPEVALGYLAAVECEVKNLRIVLTGRAANLPNDEIRERMRESYV